MEDKLFEKGCVMNQTIKDYIHSFLPSDECIPCALARKDEGQRQSAILRLIIILGQGGVGAEEIRQGLGLVPGCLPKRCVTVSQLIEEIERRHPELAG